MMTKKLPSKELLNQVFDYCPDSGDLFWKERPASMFKKECYARAWNTKNAGKKAGAPHCSGYLQVTVNGQNYLCHRIIWALVNDDLGELDIDHINGNRDDNRICNLRAVTRAVNRKNAAAKQDSKHCGVSSYRDGFRAYIGVNGKQKHLGVFDSFADALAAREAAKKHYGFTDRHGAAYVL